MITYASVSNTSTIKPSFSQFISEPLMTFENTLNEVINLLPQSRTRSYSSILFLSRAIFLQDYHDCNLGPVETIFFLIPLRNSIKMLQQLKILPENSILYTDTLGAAAAALCYAAPCRAPLQPQFVSSCGRSHNTRSSASICSSVCF